MRIAVIFVAVGVVTAPVPALASCMSFGEARHQFGAVHLYWHGENHCWDASPGRGRYAAKAERPTRRQKLAEVQQPKWREARSELLVDDRAARAPQDTAEQSDTTADSPVRTMPIGVTPISTASIMANWSERWVEIQSAAPAHLVKVNSVRIAPLAPAQDAGGTHIVRGLALVTFGFGLVLTFVALVMHPGVNSTGPPMRGVSYAISSLVAGQAVYPIDVKWPDSGGAMISQADIALPFTLPSRLLEETWQAAANAASPGMPRTPRIRPSREMPDSGSTA